MVINFKELPLRNFKSHQSIVVNFDERTTITGDTETIAFLFYGIDTLNSKLNSTLITYQSDEALVVANQPLKVEVSNND